MDDRRKEVFRVALRVDVILLITQFLVLAGSMMWSYIKLRADVAQIQELLNIHISKEAQFVREDVWQVRNKFIDGKLDAIERKLDLLIMQRMEGSKASR